LDESRVRQVDKGSSKKNCIIAKQDLTAGPPDVAHHTSLFTKLETCLSGALKCFLEPFFSLNKERIEAIPEDLG
jgi:hypothetical protein